ncbi:MAG TPA: helix-hairpin-helix domain-containing protein [Bacteroidia bacterium]|jgi:competence ComEA-like helix-hairpin-helix protein|nr:helix-hairpin-helix domain-containing protein [Bacteroidia bacterium]
MAWKDYFAFSKRQRNGVLVLLTLILVAMIILVITDFLPPSPSTVDLSSLKSDMAKVKFKHTDSTRQIIMQEVDEQIKTKPAQGSFIEINTADSADFMRFPMIKPKVARTIVRFRDALGGYYSKEQLLQVYGMDTACYYSMINDINLDISKVEKININTATEKDMAHHPYIRKKLAKAIYDYRKENGGFKDIKEIMKLDGMDNEVYSKLSPYLSITK